MIAVIYLREKSLLRGIDEAPAADHRADSSPRRRAAAPRRRASLGHVATFCCNPRRRERVQHTLSRLSTSRFSIIDPSFLDYRPLVFLDYRPLVSRLSTPRFSIIDP